MKKPRNRIIEGYILAPEGLPHTSAQLKPDKPFAPGYYIPPITWKGHINHEEVEITQVKNTAYTEDDFDFSKLPEKFNYMKKELIEAIDDAMRAMD
jgi:hypothetical protein